MKEELLNAVVAELERMGVHPTTKVIKKLNDEILHGISIDSKLISQEIDGYAVRPTVYLEHFIDNAIVNGVLKEGQLPAAANNIALKIIATVNSNDCCGPTVPLKKQSWKNKPFVLTLCDKDLNKEYLLDKPYLDVENGFALFIRIRFGENNGGWFSTPLTEDLLKELDLSKEEAFEKAFAEMEQSESTVLCKMSELLQSELGGKKARNLLEESDESDFSPRMVYVLTDEISGAAVLYRPGLKEKIAEILNDDFYVLPNSIHELKIMPAGDCLAENELAEMVAQAIKNHIERNELLSYKVQKFSRKMGKLISCKAPSCS